jgi:hypothetical protein
MRIIWNSLGLYINRNLRMGRGVNVPRLGVFTFTPPEVRLKVSLFFNQGRHQLKRSRQKTKNSCFFNTEIICKRNELQNGCILSSIIWNGSETLCLNRNKRRCPNNKNERCINIFLCIHVEGCNINCFEPYYKIFRIKTAASILAFIFRAVICIFRSLALEP